MSVPIKRGVVEAIGAVTPLDKGKKKRIKQEVVKKAEVKVVLRVLRLAMRPRIGKLLSFASSLLFLRSPRKWTLLQLERRLAILLSQRSE